MQAWLVATGLVYLAFRQQLFEQRDAQRRHMEREEAQYQKYEEDWDRCGTVPGGTQYEPYASYLLQQP